MSWGVKGPEQARLEPNVEVFDLSNASARLWPFTRRARNVGVLAGIAAILIAVFVLLVSVPPITRGQASGFMWIVLGIFGYVATLGGAMMVSDIRRRVPGAVRVRISDAGVMLLYPDGREVSRAWTDPRLKIVLYDFSRLPSTAYKTPDYPYMLRDHGVASLLTERAYRALLEWAGSHALVRGPETSWNNTGGGSAAVIFSILPRVRTRQLSAES